MATQEDVLSLIHLSRQVRRSPMVRMEFLHQRVMRTNDRLARRTFLKSKNLIGLIFGHRSTALSASSAASARIAITLVCHTPAGKSAVEISFK